MKQVTIDTVRERIAELEMVNSHGELSLRGEFELECLRMLADSMGGVDDDVRNVVALLENNEWAEHCTNTVLGSRLESEITRLVGGMHPVPYAYAYDYAGCETCEGFQDWRREITKEAPPDWMLETGKVKNLVKLYTAPPAWLHIDEIANQAGINTSIADAYMQGYHDAESRKPAPVAVPDEMTVHGARMEVGFNRYLAAGYTDGWNACRAKVIGNMFLADMDRAATRKLQELTADNTAQQFEALATSAGSGKP